MQNAFEPMLFPHIALAATSILYHRSFILSFSVSFYVNVVLIFIINLNGVAVGPNGAA